MRAFRTKTATPRRLLPALLLTALLGAGAQAQSQKTAARPDRGVVTGAAYSVSDVESISLTSGNVNLSIPLASLPPIAGGKLSWTISATYNSKLWNVTREEKDYGGDSDWRPYVVDTPQVSDLGGWRVGAKYQISIREATEDFNYEVPRLSTQTTGEDWVDLQSRYFKVLFITPDGAEHELRPNDSQNFYSHLTRPYLQNYYRNAPLTPGAPTHYYSIDGSYLSAVFNPGNSASDPVVWTVFMPDGTQVIQYNDGVQRIRDTNGNSIKIEGAHYQDEQSGRAIKIVGVSDTQSQVWYQTVGGTWVHIDLNFGTTRVQGKIYQVSDWTPTGAEDGGGGMECTRDAELEPVNLTVLREIVYPETEPGVPGRKFTFGYNSDQTETYSTDFMRFACRQGAESYSTTASVGMGALSRMVTPAGAVVDYTYTLSSQHRFFAPDELTKEIVTGKVVRHDGVTDRWEYSIAEGFGGSVTNPDGSSSNESCYPTDLTGGTSLGAINGKGGLVYRSNSSDKVLVERHWARLVFTGANDSAAGTIGHLLAFNPVVDAEYTTLLEPDASGTPVPVKMSAKTFRHDYNGNVIQVTEYDWIDLTKVVRDSDGVPTKVPDGTAVLRVANFSYHDSPATADSPLVYARRTLATNTPSIINAAKESAVGASITQISYDGQDYGVAPTRGNVTQTRRLDDRGDSDSSNDRWITTLNAYDQYGNMSTATDANGHVTQLFYEDETHALPTRVLVDPLNGTGPQTSLTTYDFHTGLVTRTTDANGQVSSIDYTNQLLGTVDPYGRPGVTTSPAVTVEGALQRRKVFNFYEDRERRVRVESDLKAEGDRLLKSRVTKDEAGRVVLSERSEDGANYTVSSRTLIAQGGRVVFTSNSRRVDDAATDGWTRATKDNAGRTIEVATFSGAEQPPLSGTNTNWSGSVTTNYHGNEVTVMDQAGKTRRNVSDALGRLEKVVEAPGVENYGYETEYKYDALGNLSGVIQGKAGQTRQTRNFVYDSVSRLRSATNPESGTIRYEYDPNGNLRKKIDPRLLSDNVTHVQVDYDYDALNRLISRAYTDATPGVIYTYDAGEYTDAQGMTRTIENALGRLTKVSSSASTYCYTGYDARGRTTGSSQTTAGQSYAMSYEYDLAGNLTSQTYPSGRVVTTSTDQAGKISRVASGPAIYASAFSYTAHGEAASMRLGNGLWEHTVFNSRLQPAEVGLGTSADDANTNSTILKLTYDYGTTKNTGNVLSQQITMPGLDVTQNYAYDEVNRLQSARETSGTGQVWKQSYKYDHFSNRTFDAGTTLPALPDSLNDAIGNPEIDGATNRLKPNRIGENREYQYDAAGNLTRNALGQTFSYDANNMQVSYNGGAMPETGGADYSYDGNGRRVKKVTTSGTTVYVYDAGGALIAEYSTEARQAGEAGTKYLTADTLGSPRVITDREGAVVSRHDYQPFGEELSVGRTSEYRGDSIEQQFTGQERDRESGLDYMNARYYSSTTGRFTGVDPSDKSIEPVNPQTWNRYTYCYNNPLAFVDKNGKWPTPIHNLIIDLTFRNLTRNQRQTIKDGSYSVDSIRKGGQRTERSNEHGMTIPGQTQDAAARGANEFINANISKAQKNYDGDNFSGALYSFGRAWHTVSDMTSPMHEGYQVWSAGDMNSHALGEGEISPYRLGIAIGATMNLYAYAFGPEQLEMATGGTTDMVNSVIEWIRGQGNHRMRSAHRNSGEHGPSPELMEGEMIYLFRIGLSRGKGFDWTNQNGLRK